MDTQEILQKVRKVEIKTRRLSANIFAGQYHSAFKGRGMAFSEVREYQFGDDVRDSAGHVPARFTRPYVIVFEAHRERTVKLRRPDIKQALEFLTSVSKRRCTAFILSDFYVRQDFEQTLIIGNRKHDIVAIQVYDRRAKELPDVGLMKVVDSETGFEQYIDTGSKKLRMAYSRYWNNRQQSLRETFSKSNVDHISISTGEDYVKSLMILFKKRSLDGIRYYVFIIQLLKRF